MSSFISQFWTPNTDLTSDNFDRMSDNDTAIYNLISNRYGHGFQLKTLPANFDPDFTQDQTETTGNEPVFAFDDQSKFHIYVGADDEFWRFGIFVPRIKLTLGDSSGSHAVVYTLYEITTDLNGVDTYTKRGKVVSIPSSETLPLPTTFPGFTAKANFLVQFGSTGTKTLAWAVQPFSDDVQEFQMSAGSSAPIQFYCMCIGSHA